MLAKDVLTEEWLSDVLQDSLEMDWTSTDGARAIMRALEAGLVELPQRGGQIAAAAAPKVASDTGAGLREALQNLRDAADSVAMSFNTSLLEEAIAKADAALATDATDGATGGGEDKVTDAHLNAAATPGGDLLEQAAREKVEWLFDQAFADGVAVGKSGDDSILAGSSSAYAQAAIRALKPAGDGGEA